MKVILIVSLVFSVHIANAASFVLSGVVPQKAVVTPGRDRHWFRFNPRDDCRIFVSKKHAWEEVKSPKTIKNSCRIKVVAY